MCGIYYDIDKFHDNMIAGVGICATTNYTEDRPPHDELIDWYRSVTQGTNTDDGGGGLD